MNHIWPGSIKRLSEVGGVEMPLMDLSQPLKEDEKKFVRHLFIENHILVFKNQKLSKKKQAKFKINRNRVFPNLDFPKK